MAKKAKNLAFQNCYEVFAVDVTGVKIAFQQIKSEFVPFLLDLLQVGRVSCRVVRQRVQLRVQVETIIT